jgi:hypothetical protein
MQDTELFLSLAEIAGVFVGFGALIAVRSGGAGDAWSVAGIGMIVWGGIQVVALALAPVAIGRLQVPDHALWVTCSLGFLAVFWVVSEVLDRVFPERMAMRAAWPMRARWRLEMVTLFIVLPMHVALALILFGTLPDLEAGLYFAALVLLLLLVMFELLWMVISGGRPQAAAEPDAGSGQGAPGTP